MPKARAFVAASHEGSQKFHGAHLTAHYWVCRDDHEANAINVKHAA
jgi:hypothetical protein